jgi:predicted PurR-regulated permease PerM
VACRDESRSLDRAGEAPRLERRLASGSHALDQNPIAGAQADHTTGVGDCALSWLQQHIHEFPTATELVHPVATYGHKAGEAVVAGFFTLAATWYCVSERDSIIKLLTALAPESKRERARETYLAIDRRLGAYTRLRFLMVFAVGAVLSAGFYVIGLNYWLLIGAFVGLVEIVPVVGPLVGSILVLAVGLPQSLHVAALSLLWLVVVRELQSYVVTRTSGRRSGCHPSSRSCRSQSWECCSADSRLSSRSRSHRRLPRS